MTNWESSFFLVAVFAVLMLPACIERDESPPPYDSGVSGIATEYASSCVPVNHGYGPDLWRCENRESICYVHAKGIACGFKDKPQPEAKGY